MKKIGTMMLVMLLVLGLMCGAAQAVPAAADVADLKPLERYASWTETDGHWSVYANETAAALAKLGNDTGTAAYFCVQLTGERATGLIQPELVVYYHGTNKLLADCVTLTADDVRYDFKAAWSEETLGRNTVEVLRVPLDSEGITAIKTVNAAEDVKLLLTGDKAYSCELKRETTSGTASRTVFESSSLKGLSAMLDELDALGAADYQLWDLNADRWERLYGFRPEMASAVMTDEDSVDDIELTGKFHVLCRGDNGKSVRALQDLLADKGFIAGTTDSNFGDGSDRAVRAARRYYGLLECGLADRALIDCLMNDKAVEKKDEKAETAMEALGDVCEIGLDRFWFADALTSKEGDERTVANADNILFIADGRILNTSSEELTFYWQLTAELKYGETVFPCTVVCEADEGRRLDSSLLPLAESRVLVYAEVPERIAGAGDWTIELKAGDAVLTCAANGEN